MKKGLLLSVGLMMSTMAFSQKFMTREGYIRFFSSTPVENIEATTGQASSVLDAESGNVAFQVLMTSFTFEKALMQEHFNENYVESAKFPKATFKGKVSDLSKVNFKKDGQYAVVIEGTMNIHGVDHPVTTNATITVKGSDIGLDSKFNVSPSDYKIAIPSAVEDKIAKSLEVTVKAKYSAVK